MLGKNIGGEAVAENADVAIFAGLENFHIQIRESA